MSRAPFTLRTGLIASGGALVVAALVFGAGWFTANALEEDDPAPASDGSQVSALPAMDLPARTMPGRQPAEDIASSGAAAPAPGNIPASLSAEDSARSMSGYGYGPAGLMFPPIGMPYACPAPMPDVLDGATVDVSQAGFDLKLLDDSFTLRSISVRAEGECDDNGQAASGVLAVDTNWVEIATGLEVYMTQRVSEPVPNVFAKTNAQAFADAYAFSAFVNVWAVMPMDGSAPEEDPRVPELLARVMAQVAPGVPSTCYYQQRAGSWDDLGTLGIGDPRPAMPAGLTEQHSDFTVFDAPALDCGGAPLESGGGFSASFAGTGDNTFVSVSAYAIPQGSPESYGYLDEGSAYWSNDRYSYNVSGYGADAPLGRDAIEAIALAMDPGFSAACLVTTRPLESSELTGLGFGQPAPPEGFEIVRSNMTVTEAPPASCGAPPDAAYYPNYNLYWSMQGPDGATIDASAYRQPGVEPVVGGYISEGGISWTKADGTTYSVYGWTTTGPMDRETLTAVAQSMDPTLDVSTLDEGMAGPMPVDKPR